MVSWHELNVLSHLTHTLRSLSDLTERSCCTHMSLQLFHTELTAWYHYLISLWDHGELTWTQCLITLDSQYEIIIWSHCELMLYSYELTVLSHQTNGMRSWSVLTVRSWSAHMNLHFYHTRLTVWDHYLISLSDHGELTWTHSFYHIRLTVWYHYLISLWDHGQLTWTHSFITLESQYEIIIWSHCEIMVSLHEITVLITYNSQYDLTVRSWWDQMNSQFYHTALIVWNHYLNSLWGHGELAWTHSFITLVSRYAIIIWLHSEIMLTWNHIFITLDLHYEIITYLISQWDHGELTCAWMW